MAIGSTAQRVYDELIQSVDDPTGDLAIYVGALGDVLLQDLEDIVRDGPLGQTGWSSILDLSRVSDVGLDFLAQFVGISFPIGTSAANKRAYMSAVSNWKRGTPAAIIAAAQTTLTGGKAVTLIERNGDPYIFTVITKVSETPNAAATLLALLSQKPGGLRLSYQNIEGQTYSDLFVTNAASYNAAFSTYATYQALLLNNSSAVLGQSTFGSGTFGSGHFGGV